MIDGYAVNDGNHTVYVPQLQIHHTQARTHTETVHKTGSNEHPTNHCMAWCGGSSRNVQDIGTFGPIAPQFYLTTMH